MGNRAKTTLFALMSLDGKITTGSVDSLDFDKDLPNINGIKEGLHQYYEIEKTTDAWSLISGRVLEKIGVNIKEFPEKLPVSFVVIDNTHLTAQGIQWICRRSERTVIVTSNPHHPAFHVDEDSLEIIYQSTLDMHRVLEYLARGYNCNRITIQTGSTINALLLRQGLVDYVDIIVAPMLVGGTDTASLIGGESFKDASELGKIGILELDGCSKLSNSYLRLHYRVVNNTVH